MPTPKHSLFPLSLTHTHTVLKLLKMATGMRALLDTVVQALPQVHTHTLTHCLFLLHTHTHTDTIHTPRERVGYSQSIARVVQAPFLFLCWPVGNSNR